LEIFFFESSQPHASSNERGRGIRMENAMLQKAEKPTVSFTFCSANGTKGSQNRFVMPSSEIASGRNQLDLREYKHTNTTQNERFRKKEGEERVDFHHSRS